MTNIYFLWVAIKFCRGRKRLSELTGIDVDRISEWLSESRSITLKNAIKIEKATNWGVTRDQLVSDRDKEFIATLKAEVEILKRSQPPLTVIQQVELGLAHEAALGYRKGARTDLQLSKNFNEVEGKNKKIVSEKASLRGRTEKDAAKLANFGNFVTYHQAKKVVKNGIPELVAAVNQKDCDLYLMSSFPDEDIKAYRNSYILVGKRLRYITFIGEYERSDVPIKNIGKFLDDIRPFHLVAGQKVHLLDDQVKNLITSNGGHTHQKVSIFRAFQISKHPPEKQLYFLSLDSTLLSKALSEAESEKGADKWKKITNDSNVHTEDHAEEKNCLEYETVAAWALTSFNITLFQNKNTKRRMDEENQNVETQVISQNTV